MYKCSPGERPHHPWDDATVKMVKALVMNLTKFLFLALQLPYCIAGLSNCVKPFGKGGFQPTAVSNPTDHKLPLSWHSLHCFQQQSCFTLTMLWLIKIYCQESDDLLCQHLPFLFGQHILNPAARPVPKGVTENAPASSLWELWAGWARKAFNKQGNQHLPGENPYEIPGSTPWPHLGEGGICRWSCVCTVKIFPQKWLIKQCRAIFSSL